MISSLESIVTGSFNPTNIVISVDVESIGLEFWLSQQGSAFCLVSCDVLVYHLIEKGRVDILYLLPSDISQYDTVRDSSELFAAVIILVMESLAALYTFSNNSTSFFTLLAISSAHSIAVATLVPKF